MLSSLRNIFKVPDLRNKILFTLLMIAIYRFGAHVPVPGHRPRRGQDAEGPGRSRAACSASCSCSPAARSPSSPCSRSGSCRTSRRRSSCRSSRVVIPKLEEWQNQGAVGQRKITQWTRYLTIAHRAAAGHRPRLPVPQRRRRLRRRPQHHRPRPAARLHRAAGSLLVVLTLTAGTALLMWMGELITQRGIGNGMSLLIFSSVVSDAARRSSAQVKAERRHRRAHRS